MRVAGQLIGPRVQEGGVHEPPLGLCCGVGSGVDGLGLRELLATCELSLLLINYYVRNSNRRHKLEMNL
jgi:hypothetical protein